MSFTDKVVLVTGGSSGIGAATALAFAKEGAQVVIVDRNDSNSADFGVAKAPLVLRINISEENEAATAVQRTVDEFGKLDILINNAGILRKASLFEGDLLQVYDEVMATNLRAAIHLTKLAAPHLIKTKGNVINISSAGGIYVPPIPSFMPYCVSKAGLIHFTKIAALELASYGVRVNSISPGLVNTNMIKGESGLVEKFQARFALAKLIESDEIADLVMFLASNKAKSVTGSNYVADNGALLKH